MTTRNPAPPPQRATTTDQPIQTTVQTNVDFGTVNKKGRAERKAVIESFTPLSETMLLRVSFADPDNYLVSHLRRACTEAELNESLVELTALIAKAINHGIPPLPGEQLGLHLTARVRERSFYYDEEGPAPTTCVHYLL